MQTNQDDRTNFRFQQTYADGHATFRPVWWFPIQGSVGGEHWDSKEGKGGFPSIETMHTPATAPGLGANPTYLHTQVAAGIDWRSPARRATLGVAAYTKRLFTTIGVTKVAFTAFGGSMAMLFNTFHCIGKPGCSPFVAVL